MALYPMMVELEGRKAVVVGGGRVGERKTASLIEAGAEVTVVSPEATERLRQWAEEGRVRWIRREYESGDTAGAFIVVAATSLTLVNERVCAESRPHCPLINVADNPGLSTFQVPSSFRSGRLQVAVSTGGSSPSAAAALIRQLEKQIGDRFAAYLDMLEQYRERVRSCVPDKEERGELLRAIAGVEPDELLKTGLAPYLKEVMERADYRSRNETKRPGADADGANGR